MLLKPVDEQTTRHLFSKDVCEQITRISFLQPLTNPSGKILDSPDGLVIDKRTSEYKLLKCEFKFMPSGYRDFKHNGKFDIAIVWAIDPTTIKAKLLKDLFLKNGCKEILVLSEYKEFSSLPGLSKIEDLNLEQIAKMDEVEKLLIKKEKELAFIAYIAANIYPQNFSMSKMINLLVKEFPRIEKIHAKGKANIVTALIQTKPKLIKHMYGKYYKWNDDIDSQLAVMKIGELLSSRFEIPIPEEELISKVAEP